LDNGREMKSIRKKNPLIFDLALFLAFTLGSFGALLLTNAAGLTGAALSLGILTVVCLLLIFSR
jgi:hypothetical protein